MRIPKGSGGRVEEAGRSTDWVPRNDLEPVRVSQKGPKAVEQVGIGNKMFYQESGFRREDNKFKISTWKETRTNEKGSETKVRQITGQETIHGYEGELKEDKMEQKQGEMER